MLKKRLIGVVTVKDGWAVQSFGYRQYLPLGKPEVLVENLDRWGADEILVQVIDRTLHNSGPDINLLKKLARLRLKTPLVYSGGIRNVKDGIEVIHCGADRLVLETILSQAADEVRKISDILGAQAVIASLSMAIENNEIKLFDYAKKTHVSLNKEVKALISDEIVSEVLLLDCQNEGHANGFNEKLIDLFPLKNVPLILFGGLSNEKQLHKLLENNQVAAVAVGNFLNYKEHSIQSFRNKINSPLLRTAEYLREGLL